MDIGENLASVLRLAVFGLTFVVIILVFYRMELARLNRARRFGETPPPTNAVAHEERRAS
jgi:hypothetical protein